jgi:hypothetical protein
LPPHTAPSLFHRPLSRRYDVTRRETFEQLFQWVRLVSDARKGLKPLKGTVVANKLDVQVDRTPLVHIKNRISSPFALLFSFGSPSC